MSSMIGRLRALWSAPPAAPAPPRRVWRDWLLVALVPLSATIEGFARAGTPLIVPAVVLAVVVLVPALFWRRARPLLVLLSAFVVITAFELVTARSLELYTLAFALLLVYSVFRWGDGRALLAGGAFVLVVTTASVVTAPFELSNVIGSYIVLMLVVTVGLLFRGRAASRVRELDRVRSREREDLARDLHDTVAHHVSAIAIQAQAGLADASAAESALRVIEAEATRTLTEMRSMVRVLRHDDPSLAPTATLAEVSGLAGGLVHVQVEGDTEQVAAPVAAAVYRIAQESVTNAQRHARGATRIDVRVAVDGELVKLTVHDDGAATSPGAPGYGITGMRERAALLGGTCTADRDPAGGWTVTAWLPRAGGAA